MKKRIKDFIQKNNMIMPGDLVFAGISGGADSVCLFMILTELSSELEFDFEVIHVEHGIRGEESRKDAEFVKALCGKYGVECHEIAVDVPGFAGERGLGLEEAARLMRYDSFSDIAKRAVQERRGSVSVALAHHMEDNAETILMQMIRGSGLDGMCGMEPVRKGAGGENYIRPLLAESRASIEQYLNQLGQPFCEDSTNSDLSYSRNRIRKKVLPELTAINSQALFHMNQTAERMRDLKVYMDDTCAQYDGKNMSVKALAAMPRALRRRIIHNAIGEAAGARKDITAAHIEAVEQLIYKQSGKSVDLPYDVTARRVYDNIEIVQKAQKEEKKADKEQLIDISGLAGGSPVTISLSEGELTCRVFPFGGEKVKISRKLYTKWFDYDKIKDNFYMRTRKSGDFFILDDMGHRKKLADYFIDEKIPADRRESCLVAAQDSKVFWVVGGRVGHDTLVTEDTRLVLELAYTKGGNEDGLQQEE